MLLSLYCQNHPASAPFPASLRTMLSHGSAAMLPRAAVLCRGPRASALTSCNTMTDNGQELHLICSLAQTETCGLRCWQFAWQTTRERTAGFARTSAPSEKPLLGKVDDAAGLRMLSWTEA